MRVGRPTANRREEKEARESQAERRRKCVSATTWGAAVAVVVFLWEKKLGENRNQRTSASLRAEALVRTTISTASF
jgi:hypothetical protein